MTGETECENKCGNLTMEGSLYCSGCVDCPYDDKDCVADDYEAMCEGCREDRASDRAEARNDTYD